MQKYLPVLRSCPFFTGLTDDEILSILHCVSAAKITRPRGSYIFRAGDSTEVMGLMLSGSTLVIQEDLWGHRNILSKCNTGDFFRGALRRHPRCHPEHQCGGRGGLRNSAAERQAAAHLLHCLRKSRFERKALCLCQICSAFNFRAVQSKIQ